MAMNGTCSQPGCGEQAMVIVNGGAWCIDHLDTAFANVREIIDRARRILNEPDERTP